MTTAELKKIAEQIAEFYWALAQSNMPHELALALTEMMAERLIMGQREPA